MKPIKGLVPFSVWLFAAMLCYDVYIQHFDLLKTLSFEGHTYFITFALAAFSLLCLAGVAMKNDLMSVLGGVGLTAMAIALIFADGFGLDKLNQEYVFVVLGIYFAARGRS